MYVVADPLTTANPTVPVGFAPRYDAESEIESAPTVIPVPAPTLNVTSVGELSAPPPVSPAPAMRFEVDFALRTRVETVELVA